MVNQINKILRLSESLKSEKEPPYFAVPHGSSNGRALVGLG